MSFLNNPDIHDDGQGNVSIIKPDGTDANLNVTGMTTFNGTTTAPTPEADANNNEVATTAFVANLVSGVRMQFFPSPGNVTFTVPIGVTALYITATGAGGGGGGGGTGSLSATYSGAGGGSGAWIYKHKLIVTPGQVIPITIGSGGIGGAVSGGNGQDGGDTIINNTITINGGRGGTGGLTAQPAGGYGGYMDINNGVRLGNKGTSITAYANIMACGGNGGGSIFISGPNGYFTRGSLTTGDSGVFGAGGSGGGAGEISSYPGSPGGTGGNGAVLVEW